MSQELEISVKQDLSDSPRTYNVVEIDTNTSSEWIVTYNY